MRFKFYFALYCLILAIIALIAARKCNAQALPDAPTPHILSPAHIAIVCDATARILDVVSTNQFQGRGYTEGILPHFVVEHTPTMLTFEAAFMGVEWIGARELRRHGHPKLARAIWMVDGSMTMGADALNFAQPTQRAVAVVTTPAPAATDNPGAPIVVVGRRR